MGEKVTVTFILCRSRPREVDMFPVKAFFTTLFELLLLGLLASCGPASTPPSPATATANLSGLSQAEYDTLASLQKLDDYPLYVMHFQGKYPPQASLPVTDRSRESVVPASTACQTLWGCSLFAALGDEHNRLYGRNFDWQFSPAILLYTDPPDGYASVSMVDITYLGFEGERSKDLLNIPVPERKALLGAPFLPFDGMNEKGVAVGMAAVPPGEMQPDPNKKAVDQLMIIREILDQAATLDEAVEILGSYNIDMGTVPIHYLIASASGNSALVEFYRGEMKVFRNESTWQQATNFLVSSTNGQTDGQCWRYDLIDQRLSQAGGKLATQEALSLLADVSQENTQWSVVYNLTSGEIKIVMDRGSSGDVHILRLEQTR
jgi:hypothetical protein